MKVLFTKTGNTRGGTDFQERNEEFSVNLDCKGSNSQWESGVEGRGLEI